VLVAHEKNTEPNDDLVLITNVSIKTAHDAETVYTEWRYRPQVEHTYRFDQEDGLDIFVLVLLAALFVYHIDHVWPRKAVLWLRRLGGKLGLSTDLDGPYVLLAGLSACLKNGKSPQTAHCHRFSNRWSLGA